MVNKKPLLSSWSATTFTRNLKSCEVITTLSRVAVCVSYNEILRTRDI